MEKNIGTKETLANSQGNGSTSGAFLVSPLGVNWGVIFEWC
jgi:hypothetical protein